MEIIVIRTVMFMKAISKEGKCMVMDPIYLKMVMNITESGKMIRWKERVFILHRMVIIMKGCFPMGN